MKIRQKVVVASGRQIERPERAAMHRNDIVEPHRQVRQIIREYFMNFTA
jgi:hypothetical protein